MSPTSAPRCPIAWPLVAILGLGLGGCYEGNEGLTREEIRDLSHTRGDAVGTALSGLYSGDIVPLSCGCEEAVVVSDYDLSICAVLDRLADLGIQQPFDIQVNHTDGRVRITAQSDATAFVGYDGPAMYGPLYTDGEARAGGALLYDAAIIQGQVLARFDGTLDQTGLSGEVVQRFELEGRIELESIGDDTLQTTDCVEQYEIDMQWSSPLPVPLDTGGG